MVGSVPIVSSSRSLSPSPSVSFERAREPASASSGSDRPSESVSAARGSEKTLKTARAAGHGEGLADLLAVGQAVVVGVGRRGST